MIFENKYCVQMNYKVLILFTQEKFWKKTGNVYW